jgi:hypothetical protein
VRDVLHSPGQALDQDTRAFMEPRFGYDFSSVRVHSGPAAEQSAREMNAHAYTVGHDIVMGAGQLAPATDEGKRLLAHELTHVVQAGAPGANGEQRPSSVESLEREARASSEAVANAGAMPQIHGSARGLSAPLRQTPDDPDVATYGNKPRDMPEPDRPLGRVVLSQEGGVWYEERLRGKKFRAEGPYDFVVQKGKIWAVKARATAPMGARMPGHTEAAAGDRVEYAGQVTFGRSQASRGVIIEWSNVSGHYAPASDPKFAAAAGLPLDERYKPLTVGFRGKKTQLPVYQPKTRPRDGGKPKIPRGSPRLADLDAHLRAAKIKTPPTPSGGSAPPVSAPVVMPPSVTGSGPVASRPTLTSEAARAIAALDAEATRAAQFTGRIRTYIAAYGALQHAISLLDTVEAAEKIFFHGTVFEEEQRAADDVATQSRTALEDAESSTAGNAYLGAIIEIGDAQRSRDQQRLFSLAGSLVGLGLALSESAASMNDISADIDAQAQAMLRAAKNNKKLATQGMDDAAMAQAAAFYISTEKLGNTLRSAAENYHAAAETLGALAFSVESAAGEAEESAWAIGYARIIKAQQEIDRRGGMKP